MLLQKRNVLLVELFLQRFRGRGNHHAPTAANRRQKIRQRLSRARAGLHDSVMMRFECIVHQFRHLQLRRPVFVVGADRRAVKTGHHALFEESSWAKHLVHSGSRRFVSRRSHLRFPCRIGYALAQKSTFALAAEIKSPVTIAYPSPVLAASRAATKDGSAFLARHSALEHASHFCSAFPFSPL